MTTHSQDFQAQPNEALERSSVGCRRGRPGPGWLRLRRSDKDRRGATVVEVALILPVFLVFVFAIIEFGHFWYVRNIVEVACREGARVGCTEGTTNADVLAEVRRLASTLVEPEFLDISIKDASVFDGGGSAPESNSALSALPNMDVSEAEPTQLFLVQAELDYNDVAILPLPRFLGNATVFSTAFMRHE